MTYIPFETRFYPFIFYYIFLSIFGILATFQMLSKWRERKVPAPLYLSLVFTFLTTAIIGLLLGLGEAAVTGYFKEIYRFSLPFAFSMVVIADIFLYLFVITITRKDKKKVIPFFLTGIAVIILLFLPWNWWGTPSQDYVGQPDIRLFSTSIFVIYSYVIYVSIAIICYKTKNKTEDLKARTGLILLFYSMISLIIFFIMLILDTLMITFYNHPGYSEFAYIGWGFAVLFIILSYLSLVMPDWLVKWLEKKK